METVRIFLTRPVNFKIYAGGPAGRTDSDRPGRLVILRKVFVHCSMYLIKNFRKGGGHGLGVKICDCGRGFQKKKRKIIFVFFAKITQF